MFKWYVLYTKVHSEQKVATYLSEHGYQVYLPLVPVARQRRDRAPERPYFPGYLFVSYDLDALGLSRLAYTPGARTVVSFGDEPATISDRDITQIRAHLSDARLWDAAGQELRKGDAVQILSESFQSVEAVFDRTLSPDARVRVLLRYLERNQNGRKQVERLIPLELDAQLVKKKDSRK